MKEKVREIKVDHAKKDKRMAALMPIMLVVAYFATYLDLGLAIVIGIMALVVPLAWLIKDRFSEIAERLELLEDELEK